MRFLSNGVKQLRGLHVPHFKICAYCILYVCLHCSFVHIFLLFVLHKILGAQVNYSSFVPLAVSGAPELVTMPGNNRHEPSIDRCSRVVEHPA